MKGPVHSPCPGSASAPRLLLVEADSEAAARDASQLRENRLRVHTCATGGEALELLGREAFDLVLADAQLPGEGGLELLERVLVEHSEVSVLILARDATVEAAVAAMRQGAAHYLARPFTGDQLGAAVREVLGDRCRRGLKRQKCAAIRLQDPAPDLVGTSRGICEVKVMIRAASQTTAPVLIHGASGTGKELVARAIHQESPRRGGPFVPVNCGALPADLIESELFGHIRGAYTGASGTKAGLFRVASGGTLLLDEVSEMPMEAQVKLLRVLQEHTIRPVGGTREEGVDVRVLAATNRLPLEAIRAGLLREDLYYRLTVLTIDVPPLAARLGDVALLAHHILGRLRRQSGGGPELLDDSALRRLEAHTWPGNVRELENVLEAASAMAFERRVLHATDLPERFLSPMSQPPQGDVAHSTGDDAATIPDGLQEGEAFLIRRALDHSEGNKTRAARLLRISRPLLYKRMKRHGIEL